MSDLRLSERLKLMADCHAKAKDPDAGMFHDAAQALVSLESTNAALAKRVAELESILDSWIAARKRLAERMRDLAEALRKLSPGPHTGPMDAEDYVPLISQHMAELKSQLAWTPVSAGLPTEPGVYEFQYGVWSSIRAWRLDDDGDWFDAVSVEEHLNNDSIFDSPLALYAYTAFRRIELPKDGEL